MTHCSTQFTKQTRITLFRQILIIVLLLLLSLGVQAAAPAFTLKDLNGQNVSLKQFKGEVVYLDFWATWCPPCRKSFPWMDQMHQRYKDLGLKIIAVSLDGKRDVIDKFLKENPVKFLILHDPDGKVADAYKLKGMPSSYLIDRQGNIRVTHAGFRDKDKSKLESSFKELLAE
ncbi:MAG: TlpA family protein disulfide reductase [Gammaproteobacteria bacterium]|nr:TlpA family protein disulfide reductase [Gammaproteobacteria bacterium]MDH5800939.1 TlpA family protein disulfide reductase [Gammaproteobacteria bacterium]